MKTKAAIFARLPGTTERRIELDENVQLGELEPDEVLVRVVGTGICQTDIKILHGQFRESGGPQGLPDRLIAGHEMVGTVAQFGDEATCQRTRERLGLEPLAQDTPVVLDPNIFCAYRPDAEPCLFCRENDSSRCRQLTALGVNRDGGFARYCRVPASQLLRVPDPPGAGFNLRWAAFTEPFACVLWGIDRAGIVEGDTVVVLGGGPIGMLMLQAAHIAGAWRLILSEPSPQRRALAGQALADLQVEIVEPDDSRLQPDKPGSLVGPHGADIVIECAGAATTLQQALQIARPGGTIEYFAVSPQGRMTEIEPYLVFEKQLRIVGSCIYPDTPVGRSRPHKAMMRRALDLLVSGRIRVAELLTDIHPLEGIAGGIEQIVRGEGLKHQVDPWMEA